MSMSISNHDDHHNDADDEQQHNNNNNNKSKIPMLLFTPTKELITNTFRLASISRDIGLDFHPSPSLTHLYFSFPSSPPNDTVPLPFPSLSTPTVSLSLLRYFVSLSNGLFNLVFFEPEVRSDRVRDHCCWSVGSCLFCKVSGSRVGSMDDLCRELAGRGWSFYKTYRPPAEVYLFVKKEVNRVRVGLREGESRIRELRLPSLDFRNQVPLKVLLYILLMTDDIFYLA